MKVYLSPSSQPGNAYAGGGTNEQVQCNRIAEFARQALVKNGYDARKAPEGQSYEKNVAESNAWGANLHIPIHTNAGGGKGVEMFAWSGSVSDRYVTNIYAKLLEIVPTGGRGIKAHSGLYEINATNCVCAYIEVEFHDNATYAKWIVDNVQRIGEAIACGVCKADGKAYIPLAGLTPPTPPPPPPSTEKFTVGRQTAGYSTATDASMRTNAKTTVAIGTYFIFKTAGGMLNVSKVAGAAGSWINPADAIAAPPPPAALYRVRASANDVASQKGAYSDLDNAKKKADEFKVTTITHPFKVFDTSGKQVYP
jgi:N-acetylmuramoyl-L-alanine amidase